MKIFGQLYNPLSSSTIITKIIFQKNQKKADPWSTRVKDSRVQSFLKDSPSSRSASLSGGTCELKSSQKCFKAFRVSRPCLKYLQPSWIIALLFKENKARIISFFTFQIEEQGFEEKRGLSGTFQKNLLLYHFQFHSLRKILFNNYQCQ